MLCNCSIAKSNVALLVVSMHTVTDMTDRAYGKKHFQSGILISKFFQESRILIDDLIYRQHSTGEQLLRLLMTIRYDTPRLSLLIHKSCPPSQQQPVRMTHPVVSLP